MSVFLIKLCQLISTCVDVLDGDEHTFVVNDACHCSLVAESCHNACTF